MHPKATEGQPTSGRVQHRATGASLTVILLVAGAFIGVIVLHLLRTDLDPVREVMSGYANGSYGVVMTIAFYALGVASMLMAFRLPRSIRGSRLVRVVAVLLGVAGGGLVVAGVFEVERPVVPDTIEETIHSNAAILAFVLLVAAMVLFAVACRTDPRWQAFFPTAAALAGVATAAAAFSPVADTTPWTGIAQRLLGLSVFAWMLLVAVRIRFENRTEPGSDTP